MRPKSAKFPGKMMKIHKGGEVVHICTLIILPPPSLSLLIVIFYILFYTYIYWKFLTFHSLKDPRINCEKTHLKHGSNLDNPILFIIIKS